MRPYDQQPDETLAAYRRFLFYRNLGPTRSLEAAYQSYQDSLPQKAAKSGKKRSIPGSWMADSARYRWTERATIWDIDNLNAIGEESAVRLVEAVRKYTDVLLESLGNVHPTKFDEVTRGLELLAKLFPNEAIGNLIQSHQRHDDESV